MSNSTVGPADTAPPVVIECKDLWKVYGQSAREVLAALRTKGLTKDEAREKYGCVVGVAGVSFSVRRGETLCVMGLSGCGKSTLLRHINRLIEPSVGEVWINGQNVSALAEKELRALRASQIGMVFQNMALWPHFTVLQNVMFALHGRGIDKKSQQNAARSALRAVRLDGWEDHYLISYPEECSNASGLRERWLLDWKSC
ncbi:L-proline glycine betaine ABC transport system permease protein ProV [Candidatus Burkholderia verschuerenii]|uniref:L-proline glycine betaine ABC transport system permease protein ProV n=1 Tax=Candidatus Burkholderia verschuerenii TaxID=242163 RepID=A0A0L0M612_9BURK|nr:ATP-binding cassette domain-containing protein [Candidatus Burkholderia verschuerenii]KND57813.1 L-proline glycine betaine ABC transport system permease protein ProV [Candidatus Burkholderia verschuerenii]